MPAHIDRRGARKESRAQTGERIAVVIDVDHFPVAARGAVAGNGGKILRAELDVR
jgi:hypothetical protein